MRRMKETVGDLDILAVSKDPLKTMDKFVELDNVETVIAK
jgi:DNA polymerase/3'-5' exonuclease PolX